MAGDPARGEGAGVEACSEQEAGGENAFVKVRHSLKNASVDFKLEDDEGFGDSNTESEADIEQEKLHKEIENHLQNENQFSRRRATRPERGQQDAAIIENFKPGRDRRASLKAPLPPQELPEKSGWVKKVCSSWIIDNWQWRWLVVRGRRVSWYDGPDMIKTHGAIDFELVEVDIEQLWEAQPSSRLGAPSSTTASSTGSLFCGPRGRTCVDLDIFSSSGKQDQEVAFRICAAGSKRAFEMRVASAKEGSEWVSAIAAHLADAAVRCNGRARMQVDQLGRAWWRISRISAATFASLAQTGDVLLFRSPGALPKLIRMASSGGRYDHVGLILKLEGGKIGILEATGNEGVGLVTWDTFLANDWQDLYPELALRRVRCPRQQEQLDALQEWVSTVIGKPYRLSYSKLARRGSVGGNQADFFCSQLVAEGLKVLGVIPRGEKASSEFWPSTFSAKSAPIHCVAGCSFDPEDLTIDFKLRDESKPPEVTPKYKSRRQRDATAVTSMW
eukprot:TRINITY_DN15040_c0_g1_i1.p1 TRINITY_DN15040_c0_g1~~TRINITY_DN15040_c0_g1_i1.p1  ORF type:complete len:503 (-),score=86.52 TRINITY_DN15040_c0_g1_i1:318-1826(-)